MPRGPKDTKDQRDWIFTIAFALGILLALAILVLTFENILGPEPSSGPGVVHNER